MTKKGQKGPKKGTKGPKKDQKRTKGLFLLICPKKDRKDYKSQKTPRVPPWVFITVINILVFFYFYKVNEKSSF